jgi:hypothetical protein
MPQPVLRPMPPIPQPPGPPPALPPMPQPPGPRIDFPAPKFNPPSVPRPPVRRQTLTLAKTIDPYWSAAISADTKLALVATTNGELAVYTGPDFALKGTYPLARPAVEIALDSRRGRLYAATAIDPGAPAPQPGSRAALPIGDLDVYEVRDLLQGAPVEGKLQPKQTIPIRARVESLGLAPDGQWLYYLDTAGNKIGRINTNTLQIEGATPPLLPTTDRMCLTPDGKTLYAASHVGQHSATRHGGFQGTVQ